MISVRWRYPWQELWAYKMRSLLVILSIAVGIFAFGIIAGASGTLERELSAEYGKVQPANGIVHTSFAGEAFGEEVVEAIRRMPEVGVAEGRSTASLRFLDGSLEEGGEWHDLRLFALEDYEENQVDIVRPFGGEWPPADRALLIERQSLPLTGAKVGDSLLVETDEGVQRQLHIGGLTHDMGQAPAQITGIPYGYVNQETLEWLGISRTFNELHFTVAQNPESVPHTESVAEAVADKLERNGIVIRWTEVLEPGTHFAQEFLPTILLILTILGVMALVLSGFLVINVVTAILVQQTRQIGVMKAIGARSPQIVALYVALVLTFGAGALLISVPLGLLGANVFAGFIASQLNFDLLRTSMTPTTILLQILIGLLTPVLAAIIPITGAARVTVREAIQDQGLSGQESTGQMGLLQKIQSALSMSQPLRLALRNMLRRRGRLIRTLIPLVLSGAVFMSVLSVRASLFQTLNETLISQGYDVQFALDRPYRIQRIQNEIEPALDGGIAKYWRVHEGIPVRSNGRDGDSVRVHALPAETVLFAPDIVSGRWLTPSDANSIVVSSGFFDAEPGTALGSTITLRIGAEENEWRIVGVHKTFQAPTAPQVVYVNQKYLWQLMGSYQHANVVRIAKAPHDAEVQRNLLQEIEPRLQKAVIEVESTRTAAEDLDIFTERFNIITTILTIMAALLATVGGLGLMATMSINVLERRREIGIIRAIGAADRAVLQIFIVEGIAIGAISWLGALILSQPMSRLMGRVIGQTLVKWPLSYVFDLRAPVLWIVIIVVVSVLASIVPARNAARISVRETLAYL